MWEYTIKIQTPENIELEFELAGIGNRFLALLVDSIIIGILMFLLILIGGIIYLVFSDQLSGLSDSLTAIILFIIGLLQLSGYYILFETIWNGQTPGKRLFNIRVIRDNGQPVGFIEVFIRNIVRIVDMIIGVYFILFTKTEKRLGDLIIGTMVIKEKEVSLPVLDSEELMELTREIPNISRLEPRDFTLIGSYLKRREKFDPEADNNLQNIFITHYFKKLGIENAFNIEDPEKMSSTDKIYWLIDIYNAYKIRGKMNQTVGGTD